jgi:hypothetical protein
MMSDRTDVMVIGIGDLGGWIVELLSRMPGIEHRKIIVASRNENPGLKRAYSATIGSSFIGKGPNIEFVKLDLNNIDKTGRILRKYQPKIICNCATLQPWWAYGEINPEIWSKIESAGFGPWGPIHITLVHKLMQAVTRYEIRSIVINCCYPDLSNVMLYRSGFHCACGIGNGDLLIPGIKMSVAANLSISPNNVYPYLIMHHSHLAQFMTNGAPGSPYFLKIMAADKDVTLKFDLDKLIMEGINKWLPGRHTHAITASSTVKTIYHLLLDTGEISFAPGPNGEIGGYPVRMNSNGVEIILPDGISMQKARELNENAQKKDGIEKIRTDGTVVLTEKAYNVMNEYLHYDCKEFNIAEIEERSDELLFRYKELKKRFPRD